MESSAIIFWVCALFLGYALQRSRAVSLNGVCAIILLCYSWLFGTYNIVLTDPGNEIDDELFLRQLFDTQTNSVWYIVCVPFNASVPNADHHQLNDSINRRIERVRELFENEFGDKNEYTNDKNAKFILGGPEIIPSGPIDINFLVQIARRNT